jgi:hypothetical protein
MPKNILPEHEPKNLEETFVYSTGEFAECIQAISKAQRFGLEGVDPRLPPEERRTNREQILLELIDAERAIRYLRRDLGE